MTALTSDFFEVINNNEYKKNGKKGTNKGRIEEKTVKRRMKNKNEK
ncbi:MAG: hypothetical protein PHI15_08185 [Methanomicrobium sp.]|nr:hypothetical protein [Methanomicrobium sp.]